MNKKELKKYAQKFAALEIIIEKSSDKEEVKKAKEQIFQLSSKFSPEDMFTLDEMIIKILEKNA